MHRSSAELGAIAGAHPNAAPAGRATASGTLQVFLAESLLLPTGLITAAYLTRHLGPSSYGVFTLAATVVASLSWILASALGRASVRMMGSAEDSEAVASTLLRVFCATGFVFALGLAAAAYPLAKLFAEPELRRYLLIFSVELFLFGVVHAHRDVLVGTGRYGARARAAAARWLARLLFIVVLVELGLSVIGAILGSIAATAVELAVCRLSVRPRLSHPRRLRAVEFLGRAAPLIGFGICMRLFSRIDLFALKASGASAATAGFYGAAQNLAIVPSLLALSFAPLLLASLTRMQRMGNAGNGAKTLARNALRFGLATVPFAGMVAGATDDITATIFGASFAPTAPLLALLIFSAVAQMILAIATAILVAAGYSRWTFGLAGTLVALVLCGLVFTIPRYGPIGAAAVTTAVAAVGAVAAIVAVRYAWGVVPPLGTGVRGAAIAGAAYIAAGYWPATGWGLLAMVAAFGVAVPGAWLLTGELGADERQVLRSWFRAPWIREQRP